MIKTTVKQPARKGKPYPKLMKGKLTGIIVFFQSECRGQVLREGVSRDGPSTMNTGVIGTNWDPMDFEDFEGTITLENEATE